MRPNSGLDSTDVVGKSPTVLVVEDDPDIRETLADALVILGYRVVSAANGSEALTHLRAATTLPDVILLDLMMPVMPGWEFRAEQLRDERIASIPVVVLTGVDRAAESAASLQASAIVTKPFTMQTLLAAMRPHV